MRSYLVQPPFVVVEKSSTNSLAIQRLVGSRLKPNRRVKLKRMTILVMSLHSKVS